VVSFATGGLLGLFLLFLLDGTKRVQAILVVLFGGSSFVLLAIEIDRIIDTVGRSTVPFLIGLTVGLVIGLAMTLKTGLYIVDERTDKTLTLRDKLRWIHFPGATKTFLWCSSAIVLLTGIDYMTRGTSNLIQYPRYQVLLATIGFVFPLIVFTQYEYQRKVVLLSPPDEKNGRYHPYVMQGLYSLADDDRFHAFPINANSDDVLTDHTIDTFRNSVVGFRYVWPTFSGLSSRKAIIESRSLATEDIPEKEIEKESNVSELFKIVRWISHYIYLTLPNYLRELFADRGVLSSLDHADKVVLIAPAPMGDGDIPDDKVKRKYRKLFDRYESPLSTEVILAVTEFGDYNGTVNDCRISILDNYEGSDNSDLYLPPLASDPVFPIDENAAGEDGPFEDGEGGFKNLLRELSK
jgi:hypothetical protein